MIGLTIEVFGPFYEQSFRSMVPPDVFVHQHGSWADDYRESVPELHNPASNKHVAIAEIETGEIVAYIGWEIGADQAETGSTPRRARYTSRSASTWSP